jgi:CrcB protein
VGAGVSARTVALVAAGGAVGGPLRYAVEAGWPTPAGSLPWATLVVNVAGAFALGVLAFSARGRWDVLALVGTGFLGAFTTFSTWVFQVVLLLEAGRASTAALYLLATATAGVASAVAGGLVGRQLRGRRHVRLTEEG